MCPQATQCNVAGHMQPTCCTPLIHSNVKDEFCMISMLLSYIPQKSYVPKHCIFWGFCSWDCYNAYVGTTNNYMHILWKG